MIRNFAFVLISVSLVLLVVISLTQNRVSSTVSVPSTNHQISNPTLTPIPTAQPTTTPTPKILSFAERNQLYGPCTKLPVLMYHHVQDLALAKAQGHASLTVDTKNFFSQLQYLKDHSYTPITVQQLISFFDQNVSLPPKPILLTFDDGYSDFATDAAPLLQQFGFPSVLFLPTGLANNPGYLDWNTITSLSNSHQVYIGNHTWSHKALSSSSPIDYEISTANTQLNDRGLNQSRVFAYPYGTISSKATGSVASLGYKIAFTTQSGTIQCKGQRLLLPRLRVGNFSLAALGL